MSQNIYIVCPCYFDVSSFLQVKKTARQALDRYFKEKQLNITVRFLLIDDSAGQDSAIQKLKEESDVEVITPPYNLGHQAALVYALRELGGGSSSESQIQVDDFVVTMDSDGEDRPEDIPALLEVLLADSENIHKVSVAKRTKRTEKLLFKILYLCFKSVFLFLTGTVIRNGNFASFRGWLLKQVIFHPHFDQCYASSFISLPLQVTLVPLARGNRYEGKSKMGYFGLFTHGIRMLMPFTEKIAVRGAVSSAVLLVLSTFTGLVTAYVFQKQWLFYATAFCFFFFVLTLGLFVLLFATFSQTKARSLSRLHDR